MTSGSQARGQGSEPGDRGRAAVVGLRQRMKETFVRGPRASGNDDAVPAPSPDRPLTDAERRRWIRSLEPLERRWGTILAGVAALLSVYSIYEIIHNPTVSEKITGANGHSHTGLVHQRGTYELVLVIQLVLALGMYIGVRYRRRSWLAFSGVMTGLVASSVITLFFGVPFLVFFGWLIVRAWRVQRYGSPTAKGAAAGAVAKREAKRSGKPTGAPGRAGAPVAKKGTTAKSSDPSKRYTPKSTKPKAGSSRYTQNQKS